MEIRRVIYAYLFQDGDLERDRDADPVMVDARAYDHFLEQGLRVEARCPCCQQRLATAFEEKQSGQQTLAGEGRPGFHHVGKGNDARCTELFNASCRTVTSDLLRPFVGERAHLTDNANRVIDAQLKAAQEKVKKNYAIDLTDPSILPQNWAEGIMLTVLHSGIWRRRMGPRNREWFLTYRGGCQAQEIVSISPEGQKLVKEIPMVMQPNFIVRNRQGEIEYWPMKKGNSGPEITFEISPSFVKRRVEETTHLRWPDVSERKRPLHKEQRQLPTHIFS